MKNVEKEELEKKELEEKYNEIKKKKKKRVITDVIITVIFLIIILEAVIGIVNMQKLNNDEKPVWYISTKTKKTELKTETIYNLGLYKIVKTDTAKRTTVQLKPFFIGD